MATSRSTRKTDAAAEPKPPAPLRRYQQGQPAWIELGVEDTDRAATFYKRLFGWEHNRPAGEKLTFGVLEGERVAGFRPIDEGSARWAVYLCAPDLDASVSAAEDAGATVVVPPRASASWGRYAVVTDPTDGEVGLWEAETLRGIQAQPGHGTPTWFELATVDHDRAVTFYTDALGWDARELARTDELTYSVLGDAPEGGGGIMSLPAGEEAGSRWSIYFGTPDTDASVRRVVEIGGSVVTAPEDTPYGRLAAVADDQGAVFHLMGPTTES